MPLSTVNLNLAESARVVNDNPYRSSRALFAHSSVHCGRRDGARDDVATALASFAANGRAQPYFEVSETIRAAVAAVPDAHLVDRRDAVQINLPPRRHGRVGIRVGATPSMEVPVGIAVHREACMA